jgi:hypothetical protein
VLREIRRTLEGAGFTDEGILKAIGMKSPRFPRDIDTLRFHARAGPPTPLATFIRLFLLEMAAELSDFSAAIAPAAPETWQSAGLVSLRGHLVFPALRLIPFRNLIIAWDMASRLKGSQAADYVTGIGSSSLTLLNLTVRRESGLTLDLGTGCGIQGLLATSHSREVVAVDKNLRAVGFAAFNAEMNQISNFMPLEGDLFKPVMGRGFDLIIANPPFVISPDARFIYRDSGMAGDQICREIILQAPAFMNEGGFCQVLCNWAEFAGEAWEQRLAKWFDGSGCDVWVIRSETQDVETYALTWIRNTEQDEPQELAARFKAWMSYYEQMGIQKISAGLISMRKTSRQPNWFRAEEAPEEMLGPCGDFIAKGFLTRDFLASLENDSRLLEMRFRVNDALRLHREWAPSEDGWHEVASKIQLVRGLAYYGNIDPYVAEFVMKCDGKRPLGVVLTEVAGALGVTREAIEPKVLDLVRRLIERGFLILCDSP